MNFSSSETHHDFTVLVTVSLKRVVSKNVRPTWSSLTMFLLQIFFGEAVLEESFMVDSLTDVKESDDVELHSVLLK